MLKGTRASLQTREKQSIAKIGKKRKPFTEETRQRMSASMKGRVRPKWLVEKQRKALRNHFLNGGVVYNKKYFTIEDAKKAKSGSSTKRYNILKKLKIDGATHSNGEWDLLKKQYNHTCPACKKSEPEIILTRDHIIPISKGGSDLIENIQPLCKRCNSHKHTNNTKYGKCAE